MAMRTVDDHEVEQLQRSRGGQWMPTLLSSNPNLHDRMILLQCAEDSAKYLIESCLMCGSTQFEAGRNPDGIGLVCSSCGTGFVRWPCPRCGTVNLSDSTLFTLAAKRKRWFG